MALAVVAAGAIVAATRGSTPVAGADTKLGAVRDAEVVSVSGAVRPAVAGEELAHGDVVTTGPHGSAELITGGRNTLLGRDAALAVVNGGRQQLRTGTAVVDARSGPGLDLDLSGDVVAIPHGSGTEAARGPSTKVGALVGDAVISSTSGRRLELPALSQAVLNGDALPARTTPLQLSDSVDEDVVAHGLVNDDRTLKGLARGIDTTGRSTAHVVEASWTGSTAPLPDTVHRSERVLPVLIADSTHGGTAQDRYNQAVVWRAEGGSWGVVLHLLSGDASAVVATLADLQKRGQAPGQVGNVPTIISAAGPSGPTSVQPPSSQKPSATTHHGGTSQPPTPSGGNKPPQAPPTLLGSLVSTVQNVLDGVLGLLPHDKLSGDPTTTKVPTKPTGSASTGSTAATTSTSTATHTSSTSKSAATTVTKSVVKTTKTTVPVATTAPTNGLLGNLLGGLLGQH